MKKIYLIALVLVVICGIGFWYLQKEEPVVEEIKPETQVEATTTPKIVPKPKPLPTATTTPVTQPKKYKTVMTTLFWVGEDSDESNGFIQNRESYWDSFWMDHYGGVDSPEKRCNYNPCGFIPKENPFYFALPYGDRTEDDKPKASLQQISWYKGGILKNTWIEIVYGNKICYAQWEDVGPFETDDFAYVFGNASPKNQFGEKAGLDVSPATWECLGLPDNSLTSWRFLPESEVPPGPWKQTITSSGLSF